MAPWTLKIGTVNVCEGKKEMIVSMFEEWKFDVQALCKTKLRGKGECEFGKEEGYLVWREAEPGKVSWFAEDQVVEWKAMSLRLMWVKVKFKRQSWVFVSAYGPSSERDEGKTSGII